MSKKPSDDFVLKILKWELFLVANESVISFSFRLEYTLGYWIKLLKMK